MTDTDSMSIAQYWDHLYKSNGCNFEKTCEAMKAMKFMVDVPSQFKGSPLKDRLVRIVYLECNWTTWNKKWGRDARGVVLFLNDESKWVVYKYLLQRGAEVLSGIHKKADIDDTQDVGAQDTTTAFDRFDKDQQFVMTALRDGKELGETGVSSKVDGSCLGVTYYFGEHAKRVSEWIDLYGDTFAKTIKRMVCAHTYNSADVMIVLSSQTTFFIGENMQGYTVTSLLDQMGCKSHEELFEIAKVMKPDEALETYGSSVIRAYFNLGMNIASICSCDVITISCETVCKNRIDPWMPNYPHTELAVSYDKSLMRILGASMIVGGNVEWMSHY